MAPGFVLERELGKGGMGVVHAALDRTGRRFALKKLRSKVDFDRVLASATALIGLDHHVRPRVRCSDLPTLRVKAARIANGRSSISPALDVARLRKAMAQVARGLRALHGAGWLHCDVKSANVLVTADQRVALCDYDLVARIGEPRPAPSVMGTPAYMSPEQATGAALSPASDWYGFGVILYELLTGVLPFQGSGEDMLLAKQLAEPIPPSALIEGIPTDLDQLCSDLLRIRPWTRPSGADVLQRI